MTAPHVETLEKASGLASEFAWDCKVVPLSVAIALMREREGWRPIETAPKDCEVIVYTSVGNPSTREGVCIASFSYEDGGDSWWLCDSGDYVLNPTHWQPLPAAPTTTGEAQG